MAKIVSEQKSGDIPFSLISEGDMFRLLDYSHIYMKTDERAWNAIRLRDGIMVNLNDDQRVILVQGTVTLENE
jgi:hypothetical protein